MAWDFKATMKRPDALTAWSQDLSQRMNKLEADYERTEDPRLRQQFDDLRAELWEIDKQAGDIARHLLKWWE
jgi:hypothetical protein